MNNHDFEPQGSEIEALSELDREFAETGMFTSDTLAKATLSVAKGVVSRVRKGKRMRPTKTIKVKV